MNASTKALIQQIVAHVTCAVCGHHFATSDIQVVGQREHIWAMRIHCRECRTQALLLAVVNDRGTQPIYTDLAPDEWKRFKDAAPIAADDVIAIHEYLQVYEGDFTDILEDPLPDE
ncbi:MAG: hypothetical protein HY782_11115 [Chloroflexi bacterium]|nr:hypothetical protein [Chloroflexota bacterium]